MAPLCAGCSTGTEILLTAIFFWLLSGATFFIFARRYFSTNLSVLGSLVYLLLPYHLLMDWFIRQAMGEFAAFAFLPLLALGIDLVRKGERSGWTIAVGVAGLALSHLPSMLLAAHVFVIITLAIACQKWRAKEPCGGFLLSVSLWVLLGVLMTSFYWIPALALLDSVSPNILFSGFFEASNWLWGTGSSSPQPETSKVSLSAFLVTLPVVLISLFFARNTVLIWISVPVALTVFMNTDMSAPIWNNWIIQKVQFPWRFLVLNDFSASIAVMAVFTGVAGRNRARVAILLSVLAVVPMGNIALPAAGIITTNFNTSTPPSGAIEYLSPETKAAIEQRFGMKVSYEQDVSVVARQLEIMADEVRSQVPEKVVIESGPRSYIIRNVPDQKSLVLPIQYWMFWTGHLEDETPLQVSAHPTFGVIEILAPKGGFAGQSIHLSLPYHISEKISLLLSLVSIAVFAYLTRGSRPWRRHAIHNPSEDLQHIQ